MFGSTLNVRVSNCAGSGPLGGEDNAVILNGIFDGMIRHQHNGIQHIRQPHIVERQFDIDGTGIHGFAATTDRSRHGQSGGRVNGRWAAHRVRRPRRLPVRLD